MKSINIDLCVSREAVQFRKRLCRNAEQEQEGDGKALAAKWPKTIKSGTTAQFNINTEWRTLKIDADGGTQIDVSTNNMQAKRSLTNEKCGIINKANRLICISRTGQILRAQLSTLSTLSTLTTSFSASPICNSNNSNVEDSYRVN